jgi:outer membrane protein OmpA-like peptidoglycan-associated protein
MQSNDPVNEIGGVDALDNGVSSPSERKADLFTAEGGNDVRVPENIFGKEDPIKDIGGSQYLGLILYKPGKLANERSYVTIPLGRGKEQITLKKNLKYCVEFSISLAESSKFAVNNIAALFSKEDFGSNNTMAIYNSSDRLVKSQSNKVFSGFYGWEQVCNIYTAKGDEKFITIGNFDKNETTKFEAVKKPKDSEVESISHAYYYVDNVIVTLIDKDADCKCYNNAPPKIEESFSNLIYSKTPELTDKMTPAEKVAEQVAYFRFGKATFSENCKEAMNFVLNELSTNPQFRIEIQGHCDAKELKVGEGVDEYYEMDRKRVAAVVKYLVDQGIDPTRIDKTYKSATTQSSEIEEDDEDEVKEAKNRRINFIIK